ncbi:SGNH/GDSL hydrolase family protein [Paenibacillus daejeonensis]|uniref:SGNH/GDSL hydrolase family protein n=1 Tax=Paenibacillus daejeonensis TaxID=135193 RepID=UPI00037C5E82|nr:SGNH/GDSL hydrolase family protein [Paenibacillus daejeonensis]
MSITDHAIQYHNVTEREPHPQGMLLRRYPREVRQHLSPRGRMMAEEATGCELRFVTEAQHVRLSVGIPEQDGIIRIYKGGLFHSEHHLQAGVVRTLTLEEPAARLGMVDRRHLLASGFAPEVWRIVWGRSNALFAGLHTFDYPVRPPIAEELPQRRWLAYGSSITHGLDHSQLSYVSQAARRLQLDIMNMGLGGSCLCEPEIADWIAARDDWEVASFELGVNMRDSFTVESFRERARYLLEQVIQRHPDKPLFLITIYPNFATYADMEATAQDLRFNEALRELAGRLRHPNLHLIEGDQIMTDLSAMTCDLIHPAEFGHMSMGEALAGAMWPHLTHK